MSLRRTPRLAARLAVLTALLMTCALFDINFYRHFAHSKYFALWLIMIFGATAALAGWRRGAPGPEDAREGRQFRLALLLVGASWFASLLFAVNVGHGLENLLRVSPILIVAWWAGQRPLAWTRDVPRALGMMIMVIFIVMILAVVQYQGFQDWWREPGTLAYQQWRSFLTGIHLLRHDRLLATLGNANSAASFYLGALALMLSVALIDRNLARRIIAGLLALFLAWALWRTRSRGGIVAGGAGLAAVGIAWAGILPTFGRAVRRSVSIALVVLLVIWMVWLVFLSGLDADGLAEHDRLWAGLWQSIVGEHGKDSFRDRLYIWQSAVRILADNPTFGIGWSQFPLIYPRYTWPEYYDLWAPDKLITTEEAHSGHLNLALETGMVGVLAWILLLGLVWRGAMRRMRWAAEGDEAARAAVIWFPPAAALLSHMLVDKFWAYPASLTLIMFSFGQLMRPRRTVAVAQPQAAASSAFGSVGLIAAGVFAALATVSMIRLIMWASTASANEVLPHHTAIGVSMFLFVLVLIGFGVLCALAGVKIIETGLHAHRSLAVFALALLLAIPLSIPVIRLASASHYLARGRVLAEQAGITRSRLTPQLQGRARRETRNQLRDYVRQGELALGNALEYGGWEIDSWTRSLDLRSQSGEAEVSDPEMVTLLCSAIDAAPNYYPVQRNLASALVETARPLVRTDPDEARRRRELAVELYRQVLSLRPDEIGAMFSQSELLITMGSPEEATVYLEDFVEFPNIDRWGMGLADHARQRLGRLRESTGDLEGALEPYEAAAVRGVRINQLALWLQIATVQVRLGRPGEARDDLAERIDTATDAQIERHRARFIDEGGVSTFAEGAIELVAAIREGSGPRARSLTWPAGGRADKEEDWVLGAVVNGLIGTEEAREFIEGGLGQYPESALLATAEAELLSP